MRIETFDDFNLYQNYRQRYTVIPITTVRGPLSSAAVVIGALGVKSL